MSVITEMQAVQSPGFPGETFSMRREKEQVRFCEHLTRRVVLEALDRLTIS